MRAKVPLNPPATWKLEKGWVRTSSEPETVPAGTEVVVREQIDDSSGVLFDREDELRLIVSYLSPGASEEELGEVYYHKPGGLRLGSLDRARAYFRERLPSDPVWGDARTEMGRLFALAAGQRLDAATSKRLPPKDGLDLKKAFYSLVTFEAHAQDFAARSGGELNWLDDDDGDFLTPSASLRRALAAAYRLGRETQMAELKRYEAKAQHSLTLPRKGGQRQKEKADKWMVPALAEARRLREINPTLSQQDLAEKLEAAKIEGLPGRSRLVAVISKWEKKWRGGDEGSGLTPKA